ncbi:MAG TPA: single-stranded DNA-binding protein [archaeon]|nr:single-stranded DNA-binding protein [archaeon]
MKVSELKPEMKKVGLTVKVEEVGKPREVVTREDGMFHKVADILVGDETASVFLSVWDEKIESLKAGRYFRVSNAYATVYKNSLMLSLGKYGKIEEITEEEPKFEVNTANNLSLRELGSGWP